MSYVAASLRNICDHLGCTISALADKAEIHRSALSRIQNGKDDMSQKLLEKLMGIEISDDDAAALAEDWTLDNWPKRAKELLMIRRRRAPEEVLMMETLQDPTGSELDRTFAALREKARGNPALARALRNLNRTLDGQVDVID
ncbi:helix-turn-helix domain-containing protein [Prosthecobacter sp.]|uniref:helix-turn-helix domain-containing protein n=1 Tax=Prosthecobacter sp. TaxID=1965333 RepID=UPI003784DA98